MLFFLLKLFIDLIEGNDQRLASAESFNKKKERTKRSKKQKKKSVSTSEGDSVSNDNTNYSVQLETKLKWAVDEVKKNKIYFQTKSFFSS